MDLGRHYGGPIAIAAALISNSITGQNLLAAETLQAARPCYGGSHIEYPLLWLAGRAPSH